MNRRNIRGDRRAPPPTAASFSPLSVTSATLFLWHRADSYTTGATDSWDDKSGNGRTATQGTGTAKPATGGAAINGFATIDFDPSVTIRHLDYATNAFNSLTGAEIFIVRKCNADATSTGIWTMGSSASASFAPFGADRNLYDDFGSNTRTAAGAPSVGAWALPHCLNVIGTASEWSVAFNFATLLAPIANTVGWSSTPRLGIDASGGLGFAGQIAEVIVYAGKLSTPDRNALANSAGSYLRTRYAL